MEAWWVEKKKRFNVHFSSGVHNHYYCAQALQALQFRCISKKLFYLYCTIMHVGFSCERETEREWEK